MSNHNHICRQCDTRYPGDTLLVEGVDDQGRDRAACACAVTSECRECAPELYKPLCVTCDESGDYSLATEEIDTPWGVLKVCTRHYDEAGERGATMWSTEDVGAGERMSAAYAAKGRE